MNVLLSFLVLCFFASWAIHHERYTSGKTSIPFFSLGRRRGGVDRRRQQHQRPSSRPSSRPSTPQALLAAVRQISTYTHNEVVAARLLESTRRANPARSLAWCAEKTIADLLRDRH